MIKVISAEERHGRDFGWLKTFWLFSFSDYYDPSNTHFGPLRVFNDDVMVPGMGFPSHSHNEMEIVTIVLQGEVIHKDVLGNIEELKAGDVHSMNAGTGIIHTEANYAGYPCHYYQLWFYPDKHGVAPSCRLESFSPKQWRNILLPIASGQKKRETGILRLRTESTIYRCALDKNRAINFNATVNRRILIYMSSGTLAVNRTRLHANDQARIDLEKQLFLQSEQDCEFLLVDLPTSKGFGYDEKTLRGQRVF